jgi:hypothetical protein
VTEERLAKIRRRLDIGGYGPDIQTYADMTYLVAELDAAHAEITELKAELAIRAAFYAAGGQ